MKGSIGLVAIWRREVYPVRKRRSRRVAKRKRFCNASSIEIN
jgi:hypothetical protein